MTFFVIPPLPPPRADRVKGGGSHLKLFLGAMSKQLNHYAEPTLVDTNMIVP